MMCIIVPIVIALNVTWESPSPINENLLSTTALPDHSCAQRAIETLYDQRHIGRRSEKGTCAAVLND